MLRVYHQYEDIQRPGIHGSLPRWPTFLIYQTVILIYNLYPRFTTVEGSRGMLNFIILFKRISGGETTESVPTNTQPPTQLLFGDWWL